MDLVEVVVLLAPTVHALALAASDVSVDRVVRRALAASVSRERRDHVLLRHLLASHRAVAAIGAEGTTKYTSCFRRLTPCSTRSSAGSVRTPKIHFRTRCY